MTRNEQEALFNNNLSIVHKLIKDRKYLDSIVTGPEDLYQSGCEALWIAVLHYDKTKKNKFSTYAWTIIKNHLHNYYKRKTNYYRNMPSFHTSLNRSIKSQDTFKATPFIEFLPNQDQKRREQYNRHIIDLTSVIDKVFDGADKETMYNHLISGYKITELPKVSRFKSVRTKSYHGMFVYVERLCDKMKVFYEDNNQLLNS